MDVRCRRAPWPTLVFSVLFYFFSCVESAERPGAAYAPLFTGVIKLADVPAYASPGAPAVIKPYGRKRRLYNFPQAPELSAGVIDRVSDLQTSLNAGRRLHQHSEPTQTSISDDSGINNHSPRKHRQTHRENVKAAKRRKLRGLNPQSADLIKSRRPSGWSGLWWAEAGGIGLAAGPGHLVHAVSTVIAVYTVDPVTGSKEASKIFALQDLFAPVGAANCREGVYDAIPLYDKHAKRYLIAATCSGKGSVLLAASATADPTGSWFLFNLIADAADTGMACKAPAVETTLAEGVRVTYNTDGVFVSLFNYCPSYPATSGATILALPKHKVYQGAPNFVYGVFAADQIAAALAAAAAAAQSQTDTQDDINLQASSSSINPTEIRQCQPAPPQTAADAESGAAYFVCDHIGPDAGVPRTAFVLVAVINTGALWQYAGTRETSPTCFLTAAFVDRGMHAPLSSRVMLQQPEGGSPLHAGGTTPAGFWSGSAVYSGGKVFTVDRLDLTNMTAAAAAAAGGGGGAAAATPVTMPSLMWTEIDVKVLLTDGGDCTSTRTWGTKWDWNKDWSIDWGKDFDLEWQENKQEAEAMQQQIQELEAAMRQQQLLHSANCTGAAAAANLSSSRSGGDDDEYMDSAAAAAVEEITDGSLGTIDGSSSQAIPANCTAAAAGSSDPSSSSSNAAADQHSQDVPLRHRKLAASGSNSSSNKLQQISPDTLAAAVAAAAAASSSRYAMHWRGTPLPASAAGRLESEPSALRYNSYNSFSSYAGWDLGCWYCATGSGGVYYTSNWFYKYWYIQWDFGWYRRYKANYAPGWRQGGKFHGHRHLLQSETNMLQTAAAVNITQMEQNDSIIIPPCLQSGVVSYKNICKQCNNNNVTAKITVNVTRSGVVGYLGQDPLGFVAPVITVTPDSNIVILTSYSGPNKIPGSDIPAYPGIASLTIPANSTTASLGIIRSGTGTVRSRTGRWTDYSAADLVLLPPAAASDTAAAAAAAGSSHSNPAAGVRLYYGVQWADRPVNCSASAKLNAQAAADTAASSRSSRKQHGRRRPQCAMPAPWLGRMQV